MTKAVSIHTVIAYALMTTTSVVKLQPHCHLYFGDLQQRPDLYV